MRHHSCPVETSDAARQVMALYPRIYFACHTRHVRDPQSHRVLSRHQASILDHLDDVDPTTLNDLARHMGVTPGTMSLAIDRLERKAYVVRLRDTADRRRVHLRLTPAGVRVRQASSVLDPASVQALVARLEAPDRDTAIRGLALLARAAQEQMESQADAGRAAAAARRGEA
jgi:DNA-binding MarR family transcriptional regulator